MNLWDDSHVLWDSFDWNDFVIIWAPAWHNGETRTFIAKTEMLLWQYWTEMERTRCWGSIWWGISLVSISYSRFVWLLYRSILSKSTNLDSEIGAMDRRNFQLATDGLGMGCNRWKDGFSEFRENGIRKIQQVCVALHHNGSHVEV